MMTFAKMFMAIHGYEPFPWQEKAAQLLLTEESYLQINVPTAAGKTALIDAALYAAAHGGPRRIAFIIDRRVVVDEAFQRAQRIVQALAKNELAEISDRLGHVQVVRLRGGVHGDDDWVLYPERTTIILSTVDQIGSRLLHRGYGVSARMAPMHAGFVGNDSLYIIDEAHLSVPFIETIGTCKRMGAQIRMIAMTATPIQSQGATVILSEQDYRHSVLAKRLQASKKARLISVPSGEKEFITAAVSASMQLAEHGRIIAVVVNRVLTARRIWQALVNRKKRAELLTGRIRPYDRDQLLIRVLPEIRAGRVRKEGAPLFVVATQTVEVGADLDFDALVCEAASLDALRQRFGRLDRLGQLGITRAAILYREPKMARDNTPVPDPIYGKKAYQAWLYLQKVADQGCVDFGIAALSRTMQKEPPPIGDVLHAPMLLPAHLKLLSQTGPQAPRIDVAPWLHGTQGAPADVAIVWRADLPEAYPDHWADVVRLQPPCNREALQMPIYAVCTWLSGQRSLDVADIEGIAVATPEVALPKPLLRWRGEDDVEIIQPKALRPGDTIVIPAAYGGCDAYGWAPGSSRSVADIADFCSMEKPATHVVRLVPGLTSWLGPHQALVHEAVLEVCAAETTIDPETGLDRERIQAAHATLIQLLQGVDHPLIRSLGRGRCELEIHPQGVVLRSKITDEIEGELFGGVAVTLQRHLEGVAQMSAALAGPHPEAEKIVLAASQHDLGKQEEHFQIMLHGDPLAAAAGPILAKSGLRRFVEKRAAYRQSGLPQGFRHELASLSLSKQTDTLVGYLIATHHGFGRPWFPVCRDSQAIGATLARTDSSTIAAFVQMQFRYGPWGLAGMELLLRAADIRQSILEQEVMDA